jgi:phage FluMu gp28-like protein
MKVQISDKRLFKSNDTNLIITLITGAILQFKTGEKPDNLYGDDVYAAVVDEASRCREESWFALRSTLTATGGKCKFIGNVKGRKNWFYKMSQKAKAGDDKNYEYHKITAYDAANAGMRTKDGRPFAEEIEEAKKDLPENVFKELYLAEASEDGSNPFGLTYIQQCVYPMSKNESVCYGVDLAKKHDYTVIIGLDKFGYISHFDRFQLDWRQTKDKILALPNKPIAIDSTGVGDPIAEDVARFKDIEMVVFTQRSKQQLMEGLSYAIQNRQISIIEGVLKDELESFEFEYNRFGVKYTAPSGLHDDTVCSLALAYKNFNSAKQGGDISIW